MSEILKPCPFCGGEAKLSTYYDFYKVHCNSDDCLAGMSVGDAYNGVGKWYGSVAEAIDAWNTRAQTVFGMTLDEVRQIMKRDAERERTCKQKRLFNLISRECDGEYYEWHDEEMPRYCPNCGAKVVGRDA